MASISRESILLISTLLKFLINAISENCSYDKTLSKLTYLPSVFVFLINVGYFLIIFLQTKAALDLVSVTAEKCNRVNLV